MVENYARRAALVAFAAAVIGVFSLMPSRAPAQEVAGSHIQTVQDVWVKPYVRRDGTYVAGHYRTAPDGNPYNNYSYPGNTNPHTGRVASERSDGYRPNYGNAEYGYDRGVGKYRNR
jgi:hypothetical protein